MPTVVTLHANRRMAFWAVAGSAVAALALWLQFDTTLQARRQWRKLAELRDVVAALQTDPAFVMREFRAQSIVDIPPFPQTGVRLVADTTSTRPRLVIFVDYDVSACKCFDRQREAFIDRAFPDGLDVEYRYAPALGDAASVASNEGLDADESQSMLASRAAAAAGRQGGASAFETMHRLLLETRNDRPGRDFEALARSVGLDVERFRNDMKREDVKRRVRDDQALAKRLGVASVPAAFLDGRRVPDLCLSSAVFWHAIGQDYASGVAWSSAAEPTVP